LISLKTSRRLQDNGTGAGTFSDNLVGFQLVTGGGLTQGNFQFTTGVTEKTNRNFNTGVFSDPINLESMGVNTAVQSKAIFENNFKVYPNFDLSQITNFTLYGSMVKRISTSVQTIISKFPAAIESVFMGLNYVTGVTASNIIYNSVFNESSFDLDVSKIRNPFDVDFSINSARNLELREIGVSPIRDMTNNYSKYSLYYSGNGYSVLRMIPTQNLESGTLNITVEGDPFSGQSFTYDNLIIRPNDYEVNRIFNEDLDEVENFLLNRETTPLYTATFQIPKQDENGRYFTGYENITWTLDGGWNLDINSKSFENYLITLNETSSFFDEFTTNLISRFFITDAFREFDTTGQKMEKVLQIYGRSFDETKKFIDALADINSVNYNVGNDIPSQLLKNLAQTLGWTTNISPITNDAFLSSVFGQKNSEPSLYSGLSKSSTPDELNYQYYRNLILNSAYLFKSKGTRKSIEILMRLIGAPDALIEFNEYVYLADQRINLNQFNTQFVSISGGTYVQEIPTLEDGNIFFIFGNKYTGFTTQTIIQDANITIEEYPMDEEGYPRAIDDSEAYFFQIGSGWFEQTPQHRAPEEVDFTDSVFTGSNPNYQTKLQPYTYGQIYLDKFRKFSFMNLGYHLRPIIDNNKSWADYEVGLRSNLDANINALYTVDDDRLVLNVKNIDLFLNPAQGLAYDVWYMSRQFNYPIPNQGMGYVSPTYCDPNPVNLYPQRGGIDWTVINPQPKRNTFFEFAQTFWINAINVRNRQFTNDGKTGGYPTLDSIYWKYLESQQDAGIENNNFNYRTMIEYVEGLGDYWIRLVEQMVPATTIWNTGVRYENSIFHRQKFVWRRQGGCQIIPVPFNPCKLIGQILTIDCQQASTFCDIYPWTSTPNISNNFGEVLNYLISQYTNNPLCDVNTITSNWYVNISLGGNQIINYKFFHGVGLDLFENSYPTPTEWLNALESQLDNLFSYGLGYEISDNQVTIFTVTCDSLNLNSEFQINVGVDFSINCF